MNKYLLVFTENRRKEAYQKMCEAKARLFDIKNVRGNEDNKFNSIKADFENNGLLYKKNYKAKIDDLKTVAEERENHISSLNQKLDELKNEHQIQLDVKNKMLVQIRTNMDELSQYFSKQLEDIQKSLQGQIDKISSKWEFNITEHLKKYEDHVKKYDINKEI